MDAYRSIHQIRCWVPDGRIVHLSVLPRGLLVYRYHLRHAKLPALREWQRLGHYLSSHGVLELDPARAGEAPDFEVYVERVPIDQMRSIIEARSGFDRPHHAFLEARTPAELVSAELVREMNEEILPQACRILKPRLRGRASA